MLDIAEKNKLLSLRLLIARAAQKDSLNWWEDDSLSSAGSYLLERLFSADPGEAGRKLALEAAKNRYEAAFSSDNAVLHLFHLDNSGDVEYGLQGIRLADIPVPNEPIPTIDALQEKLIALSGPKPLFQIVGERANRCLEINIKNSTNKLSVLDLAQVLAWVSLEGQPGHPIFPFIRHP
jgi:hypothetical protein